jgi:hypothetical protein
MDQNPLGAFLTALATTAEPLIMAPKRETVVAEDFIEER